MIRKVGKEIARYLRETPNDDVSFCIIGDMVRGKGSDDFEYGRGSAEYICGGCPLYSRDMDECLPEVIGVQQDIFIGGLPLRDGNELLALVFEDLEVEG